MPEPVVSSVPESDLSPPITYASIILPWHNGLDQVRPSGRGLGEAMVQADTTLPVRSKGDLWR